MGEAAIKTVQENRALLPKKLQRKHPNGRRHQSQFWRSAA
jgi:hypothetical protein